MRLPEFEYHLPRSLSEACALISSLEDAKVLAGGTDLLVGLREETIHAKHLVSVKGLSELRGIRYDEGEGLRLGALVTLNEIITSGNVKAHYYGIWEAARSMCAYQTRNQATLGGNLASAVPSADMPPILLALDARVKVARGDVPREIPFNGFFAGPKKNVLARDEILMEVLVPPQPPHTGSCYLKHELRGALALAVVGVAVALTVSGKRCVSAKIALGAVAPTPMLAEKAGALLVGQEPDEEGFAKSAALAAQAAQPISDVRGSKEYRKDMVDVLTRRALATAWSRARA